MDPLTLGLLVAVVTVVVLFSGMSVAVGLLVVAAGFLLVFDGMRSLELLPEIFFGDIRDRGVVERACEDVEVVFHLAALVSIPYSYIAPESFVETNPRGLVIPKLTKAEPELVEEIEEIEDVMDDGS